MIFKATTTGAVILYETLGNTRTPLQCLLDNSLFTFILKCNNKLFWQFTDSNSLPAAEGNPAYLFSYDGGGTDLNPKAISFKPSIFKYDFKSDNVNVQMKITSSSGTTVYDEAINRQEGIDPTRLMTACQFDLHSQSDGLFKITETDGSGVNVSEIYLSSLISRQSPFGLIEISNPAGFGSFYSAAADLSIRFQAAERDWKYYLVVTETDFNSYTYDIKDQGANPLSFADAPLDNDHRLILEAKDMKALLFISKNVSLKEEPRPKIKLSKIKKQNGESVPLIENMPNPSPDNLRSEIILNV